MNRSFGEQSLLGGMGILGSPLPAPSTSPLAAISRRANNIVMSPSRGMSLNLSGGNLSFGSPITSAGNDFLSNLSPNGRNMSMQR